MIDLVFGELPARALVLAADSGRALGACGGALALHVARGDAVRWLATSSAGDGPSALGVSDVKSLGLPAGAVAAQARLVERIAAELTEFEPRVVYAPDPGGGDADERALAFAAAAAVANAGPELVLVYGAPAQRLDLDRLDVSSARARKSAALAAAGAAAGGGDSERFEVAAPRTVHAVRRERGLAGLQNEPEWRATAVISTWNKRGDVCQNLDALRAQTRPFDEVVVVDNASGDDTARTIRERYPEVRLTIMPHSRYGACETFNIGFASVLTPLLAILDDDVVLPPDWLEKTVERMKREPESTAIVSSEVEEPGMPPGYLEQPHLKSERYMSTFRGCASLGRTAALRKAGFYDERLFIYGNERDLTCRLLNLGYRVLQYPSVRAFHKTPFGIKMGKRSLYYHARNAWLTQLKYAPAGDLARLPFLVVANVLLRGEKRERAGKVADATGTIGIGRSLRETPGAWWVVAKAGLNVLANVPYCWKHRRPVRAPDFELPLK
jgi:GT2 family glycosyltransferase